MNKKNELPALAYLTIQYILEEQLSAEKEKRRVSGEVWRMENTLGINLSEMFGKIKRGIKDNEFKEEKTRVAIGSATAVINILAKSFVEIRKRLFENPEEFKRRDFKYKLNRRYEIKKFIKTNFILKEILQPLPFVVFKKLNRVIWERRILRRYLRSRFGIKRTFSKEIQKKAFRKDKSFSQWLEENPKKLLTDEDRNIAYKQFKAHLHYEKALKKIAGDDLVQIEVEFFTWKKAVFISYDKCLNFNPKFNLKDFLNSVLSVVGDDTKNQEICRLTTEIKLKREFSMDYTEEVIGIAANLANKINLNINNDLRRVLQTEGPNVLETLLDKISGSVLIALDEIDSSSEKVDLLTRVTSLLKAEIPIELRHEFQQRQRQQREGQRSGLSTEKNKRGDSECFPNLDIQVKDVEAHRFTLIEEARIDLAKIIREANLSPIQEQIWFMMEKDEKTDSEVAEELAKPIGTIRTHCYRAKKKVEKLFMKT